jgi:hypothetical protein
VNSINTWICIFIEFIFIFLTFHTKNNHTLLSRVFHRTFSHKHDVHQEFLEPGHLVQGYEVCYHCTSSSCSCLQLSHLCRKIRSTVLSSRDRRLACARYTSFTTKQYHTCTDWPSGPLSSKSNMDIGSNPTHVCFRGQGFKSCYCPVSTDNASFYLKARYLWLIAPHQASRRGRNIDLWPTSSKYYFY